jgi:hypothetical protein
MKHGLFSNLRVVSVSSEQTLKWHVRMPCIDDLMDPVSEEFVDVEGMEATKSSIVIRFVLIFCKLCCFAHSFLLTSWLSDLSGSSGHGIPGACDLLLDHPGSGARAVYSHSTAATTSRCRG